MTNEGLLSDRQAAVHLHDAIARIYRLSLALMDAVQAFMSGHYSFTSLVTVAECWKEQRTDAIQLYLPYATPLFDEPELPAGRRWSARLASDLNDLGNDYDFLIGCDESEEPKARSALDIQDGTTGDDRPFDRRLSERLLALRAYTNKLSAFIDSQPPKAEPLHRDDVTILRVLAVENRATHQVDIETATSKLRTPLSRATIRKRLTALRDLGLVRRPHGNRGGDAITAQGREALRRVPLGGN